MKANNNNLLHHGSNANKADNLSQLRRAEGKHMKHYFVLKGDHRI